MKLIIYSVSDFLFQFYQSINECSLFLLSDLGVAWSFEFVLVHWYNIGIPKLTSLPPINPNPPAPSHHLLIDRECSTTVSGVGSSVVDSSIVGVNFVYKFRHAIEIHL
ncbi:hypothetical protein T07_126 [Trichinella nelsoni]|uniref:Uncharacterized protein n=1 Tax=Trichinella nelsoni TaxID=6336 RepID=A0A0V0SJ38_9BILA|nr:hypothetical protein T07_126 [Trichinella nelsoni]